MGFEILFHFKERSDKDEELKKKTIKVGDPYDDVTLDIAAGKIMSQLAHPDIILEDVEIYEYTKKKLTFKKTDDGFTIKGRKFKYDDGPALGSKGEPSEKIEATQNNQPDVQQLLATLLQNQQLLAQLQNGKVTSEQLIDKSVGVSGVAGSAVQFKSPVSGRPIRQEIWNPQIPGLAVEAKRRGLQFTLGKKYPIYAEQPASRDNPMAGMLYTTVDDSGVKRHVNDKHFTPDVSLKHQGFEQEEFRPASNPNSMRSGVGGDSRLDWGTGTVEEAMPDLR